MSELEDILKSFRKQISSTPKVYTLKEYLKYLADSGFYGDIEIVAKNSVNGSLVFQTQFATDKCDKYNAEILIPYQDNIVLDTYDMSYPVNPPIPIKKIIIEAIKAFSQ